MSDEFKPTRTMLGIKKRLHTRCTQENLLFLLPSSPGIEQLIAPTPIDQLRRWMKDYEGFWIWLVTPFGEDGVEEEAKTKAIATLTGIFDIPQRNPEGELRRDVIELQMKAAKILGGKNQSAGINVQVNNVNGSVPKGLKGMNASTIQGRIDRYSQLGAGSAIDVDSEGEVI